MIIGIIKTSVELSEAILVRLKKFFLFKDQYIK
jgi:hypothetical protein